MDTGEVVTLALEATGGSYGGAPAWKLIPQGAGGGGPFDTAPNLEGSVQISLWGLSVGGGGWPGGSSTVEDLTDAVRLIDCP